MCRGPIVFPASLTREARDPSPATPPARNAATTGWLINRRRWSVGPGAGAGRHWREWMGCRSETLTGVVYQKLQARLQTRPSCQRTVPDISYDSYLWADFLSPFLFSRQVKQAGRASMQEEKPWIVDEDDKLYSHGRSTALLRPSPKGGSSFRPFLPAVHSA